LSPTPFRTELALWIALFAGFSPAIAQFVGFEAWYAPPSTLLAPVLIAICLWRKNVPRETPRRAGAAWIAVGLLFELVGIALRTWTCEWLGFPVAVVGMALWLGNPSWRIAVLALGLVPIPDSIRNAHTPGAETALLSGACAVWRALGVAFSCTGPVARFGDRHLELIPDDVGWVFAPLLAQLGWFIAVSARMSTLRALRTALFFAAAALAIAPLAIALALGLLAVSSEAVARAWLAPGAWLACSAAAIVWSQREAPADCA
jgi:hypothetical protein